VFRNRCTLKFKSRILDERSHSGYWAYVSGALGLLCLPPRGLVGIVLGAIGLNREGNNSYAWRGIILGTGAAILWGIGLLMLNYIEGLIQ
jgi:hypothetical protein